MIRRRLLAAAAALLALLGTTPTGSTAEPDGDELLLREAKVSVDAAALEDFFRRRTPSREDARRMAALIRQLGDDDFVRRETASRQLLRWGPAAVLLLTQARQDPDPEIARRAGLCLDAIQPQAGPLLLAGSAARLLVHKAPDRAAAVLLDYLPFAPEPSIQDEVTAALASLAARPGRVDATLRAALTDERPICRAAAACALGRSPDAQVRAAVRALLADPDPCVRLGAAEGLLAGRDKTAIPVLIPLILDGPPLGERAESLLLRVAGETTPDAAVAADVHARHDAWARWWANNGAHVDLGRLDDTAPYLGLTLVPEMHANKVWECNAEGKPLWSIEDLQTPIDAQVLPGKRLLVAELNGDQVTERDRSGKILWKYVVKTPIACERLANGQTFIATNHRLSIVTRAGKEVFSYAPDPQFFIHSVQRLRNGHIVCLSMGGSVREIDASGKVVCSLDLSLTDGWSGIEGVSGDHYLVVNNTRGRVLEVNRSGKVIWENDTPGACYASRLPNGHTLIVSNALGLREIDRRGHVTWQLDVTSSLWRAHRR